MIHEKLIPLLTENEKEIYSQFIQISDKIESIKIKLESYETLQFNSEEYRNKQYVNDDHKNLMRENSNLINELKKINEENSFISMFSNITIDGDGNTQLHKFNNFTIKEYKNIVKKFDDERLLNLKNNNGESPIQLIFKSCIYSKQLKYIFENPKVNKFVLDEEGNTIFHICFRTKDKSNLFVNKVLLYAAKYLKLFMQPNNNGEFCLDKLAITDFIRPYSDENYKKLWELLFKLNENMTKNSDQIEIHKLIIGINKEFSKFLTDEEGNSIFHICFKENNKDPVFIESLISFAVKNLYLFMQPNNNGKFCLNKLAITDFISEYSNENYKKLWELLFKLYENLSKNSSEVEINEIIEEINLQSNLMGLEGNLDDYNINMKRFLNTKATISYKKSEEGSGDFQEKKKRLMK